MTPPRSAPPDLPPVLRRRLLIVACLVAFSAVFFGSFRAQQPAEWGYFRQSASGTAFLIAEAVLGVVSAGLALALWRRPAWWTLARLRVAEYVLVGDLALYIGWTQLFAFAGERFGSDARSDALLVRLAVDSIGVRWTAAIIGLSTLIPETLARNARLIALQVFVALSLTVVMTATDPLYQAHTGRVLIQMGFWMTLATTIAVFGAYKLDELRQQVAEARRLGQYQLVRPIGAGGMGEVHLAEHLLLKQPVAIKLIRAENAGDPDALARFEREVRATARLTHPNTIRIYDYGFTDDGTFYYAMEYLPGLTLDQIVQRHGAMPAARVIHVLRQVCAALAEAHTLRFVHRDIKPANIMLCERGGVYDVAKLLDFGLVRGAGSDGETLADANVVVGTPGYMSPEQAQGHGLTPAADIYAVGATMYLLLAGTPAVPIGPAVQMIVTQATTAVRPPRELRADVPDDLEAVVLRCLARDPAGRYATAAALDAALAACADHGRWTAADAESWWRTHSPPTPAGGMSPDPAPSPSRAPTRVTIAAPQRGQ